MSESLPLYELDEREPVASIDWEGVVTTAAGDVVERVPGGFGMFKRDGLGQRSSSLPRILFAEVPVILHLSCGLTIGPMHLASEDTGPPKEDTTD